MKVLKYGNTNTYYMDGLLIDTDMPGTMPLLFKAMKRSGIALKDIQFVIATHFHPDHIGLVSELMALGIQLIVVEHQLEQVHFADDILKRQYGERYRPIDERQAVVISTPASRAFLASIGICGEIIPTTSHSADGIALLLDDGNCFVGDLEPRQYIGGYESNIALEKDWKAIMARHPGVIHFGHANDQIPTNG